MLKQVQKDSSRLKMKWKSRRRLQLSLHWSALRNSFLVTHLWVVNPKRITSGQLYSEGSLNTVSRSHCISPDNPRQEDAKVLSLNAAAPDR